MRGGRSLSKKRDRWRYACAWWTWQLAGVWRAWRAWQAGAGCGGCLRTSPYKHGPLGRVSLSEHEFEKTSRLWALVQEGSYVTCTCKAAAGLLAVEHAAGSFPTAPMLARGFRASFFGLIRGAPYLARHPCFAPRPVLAGSGSCLYMYMDMSQPPDPGSEAVPIPPC